MGYNFLTTLPSREVIRSTHWLRSVPMNILDRELHNDLTVLDMQDYDVILGMDFLSKYSSSIECHKQKVIFELEAESSFEFIGERRKKTKMFLSALKAQKMLAR